MQKIEIAVIVWDDAAFHGLGSFHVSDITKLGLMELISIGIILSEDKHQITLAGDYCSEDHTFRQASTYPKSTIKHIIRKRINIRI